MFCFISIIWIFCVYLLVFFTIFVDTRILLCILTPHLLFLALFTFFSMKPAFAFVPILFFEVLRYIFNFLPFGGLQIVLRADCFTVSRCASQGSRDVVGDRFLLGILTPTLLYLFFLKVHFLIEFIELRLCDSSSLFSFPLPAVLNFLREHAIVFINHGCAL